MKQGIALDRLGAAASGRRRGRGTRLALLGAAGFALGAGCAGSHDPLTERCLEALAWHSPGHGPVERIERGPSPEGWAVTIVHRTEPAPGHATEPFRCEYQVGNGWPFQRIAASDRELRKSEVAWANARLLL